MPNWCYNSVCFTFKDEENYKRLKNLCDKTDDECLCECVLPRPEEEEENWYNWNTKNWGTKWDVGNAEFCWNDDDMCVWISFETAWSPPIGVYEALYKDWNADVKASYWEPGCYFCGLFDYNLDKQTHNVYEFGALKREADENNLTEDEEDLWLMVKEYYDEDDESDEDDE